MARYYRRRRFGRRLRRSFRSKKASLSRVKKDIMKCNFPTKVKFVGLTEKKVMFLTRDFKMDLRPPTDGEKKDLTPQQVQALEKQKHSSIIILDPLKTDNISSIGTIGSVWNWDKICILGIYIKFQPVKNTWTANADVDIQPVQCFYSSNILSLTPQVATDFEMSQKPLKQIFTFNSNEAFTMYLPAPPTMSSADACVHKSKTWWALKNLTSHAINGNIQGSEDSDMQEEDDDEEIQDYGDVVTTPPYLSAGRLFFYCAGTAKYNVTINYKVALRG